MSMGGSVGDAFIEVGAEDATESDLKKLQANLKRQLKVAAEKAGQELVKEFEKAGDDAGDKMLHELERDAKQIEKLLNHMTRDRQIQVGMDVFAADAAARIAYAARDRIVNLWLNVRGSQAAAQIAAIVKGLSGYTIIQKWTDSLVNMTAALPELILRFSLFGAAATALIAPLMNMMSAIAPLGASLGQIFPIILAGPAAFAAFAAQVTVLAMAFTGLADSTSDAGQRAYSVLQDLKDQFGDLRQVVQGNFWGEFIDSFENLTSTLMPQLTAGLAGLATVMGQSFAGIADAIAEQLGTSGLEAFFNNVNAGVAAAAPGLANFAQAFTRIMEEGATLLPAFGEWISKIGEQFNNWAQSADIAGLIEAAAFQIRALWEVGVQAWGVISGIFKAMDTGKSTGLESLAATLEKISNVVNGPAFQTALGTIFKGAAAGAAQLSDALTPIGAAFEKLAPLIANLLDTLGGVAATVLTGIAEALAQPIATNGIANAIEAIGTMFNSIDFAAMGPIFGQLGNIIALLAPVIASLVNAFLPLVSSVLPILSSLITQLAPVFMTLLTAVQPLVDVLVAGLMPILQLITPLLNLLLPVFLQLVTAITPLIAQLLEGLMPAFTALMPLISAIIEGLTPLAMILGEILPPAIDLVTSVLTSVIEYLTGFVQAIFPAQQATDEFGAGVKVFGDIVRVVFEAVANIIEAALQVAMGIMKTVSALLRGDFSGAFTAMQAMVDGVFRAFGGTLKGAAANVSSFVGEVLAFIGKIPGEIGNFFRDAGQWLLDAGRNIIDGLIRGITNAVGGLMDTIGGIASDVMGTFAGILGIASPSKVFEGFGENITEGLLKGLGGMEKAAEDMISSALKPVTAAMSLNMNVGTPSTGVSSGTSSITNNSTSTTEYQAGAFAIAGPDPYKVAREVADIAAENSEL